MSSIGTNQLTQPTINGLSNLELTDLKADNLNADNIDGNFFSIEKIEIIKIYTKAHVLCFYVLFSLYWKFVFWYNLRSKVINLDITFKHNHQP